MEAINHFEEDAFASLLRNAKSTSEKCPTKSKFVKRVEKFLRWKFQLHNLNKNSLCCMNEP
jgi:hypothetical protein